MCIRDRPYFVWCLKEIPENIMGSYRSSNTVNELLMENRFLNSSLSTGVLGFMVFVASAPSSFSFVFSLLPLFCFDPFLEALATFKLLFWLNHPISAYFWFPT